MTLLLLTGAAGMVVGARGLPAAGTSVVAMVGLALACGGASALNHVLDRDIDGLMPRTGGRPVAGGRVAPARALEFGLALSTVSFVLLASLVNVLTAVLPFAWQTVGLVYLGAALLLGAAFLRLAWRLRVETTPIRARALFKFSLVYLALLFVLMALDPILG